jgi:hypothetical protein
MVMFDRHICILSKASCLNCFLKSARSPTFATGDSPGHPRVAKIALWSLSAGPVACSNKGHGPSAFSTIWLALDICSDTTPKEEAPHDAWRRPVNTESQF